MSPLERKAMRRTRQRETIPEPCQHCGLSGFHRSNCISIRDPLHAATLGVVAGAQEPQAVPPGGDVVVAKGGDAA